MNITITEYKDKKYKVCNETFYHENTNDEVIQHIENARSIRGRRIRLFYGDVSTGRCWNEEYDTIGSIGRSTGVVKIPLLIKMSNSIGGGAVLDDCIVAIQVARNCFTYKHPHFFIGEYSILIPGVSLTDMGYTHSVWHSDGNKFENVANFKSRESAEKWIAFMKGERWSK